MTDRNTLWLKLLMDNKGWKTDEFQFYADHDRRTFRVLKHYPDGGTIVVKVFPCDLSPIDTFLNCDLQSLKIWVGPIKAVTVFWATKRFEPTDELKDKLIRAYYRMVQNSWLTLRMAVDEIDV